MSSRIFQKPATLINYYKWDDIYNKSSGSTTHITFISRFCTPSWNIQIVDLFSSVPGRQVSFISEGVNESAIVCGSHYRMGSWRPEALHQQRILNISEGKAIIIVSVILFR